MHDTENRYSGIILILQLAIIADALLLSKLLFWADFIVCIEWLLSIIVKLKDWQALASSIVGVAIACLTFWFSIKRFHHEKWWALKIEAYQRIIEALHHSKTFFYTYINYACKHTDKASEKKAETTGDIEKMEYQMIKAIDLGELIISEEARALLQKYRMQVADAFLDKLWWSEQLDAGCIATENCLENLIAIAKKDLGKRI